MLLNKWGRDELTYLALSEYIMLNKRAKLKEAKFKAYMDLLPSKYRNFPALYTVEELEFLQCSPIVLEIKRR